MTISDILNELEGHFAYDAGATDSGVKDHARKRELALLLQTYCGDDYRAETAKWFADSYLSEKGVAAGYGMQDAVNFWNWLEECL